MTEPTHGPTRADTEKAQSLILCDCGFERGRHLMDCPRHFIAWEDIADALAAARKQGRTEGRKEADAPIPPGHIKDDKGVVRRVLGTLPVTADGCVVGDDCRVWFKGQYVNAEPFRSPIDEEDDWQPFLIHKAHSSKEAARLEW